MMTFYATLSIVCHIALICARSIDAFTLTVHQPHPDFSRSTHKVATARSNDSTRSSTSSRLYTHRREFLSKASIFTILLQNPSLVRAAEVPTANNAINGQIKETNKKPNFTQSEIASFLHTIPTFAIVDPKGVPYMVVGEDAKLSAYFFTSYDEAQRILKIAAQSSDKAIKELIAEETAKRQKELGTTKPLAKDEIEQLVGDVSNPWKNARISSLPLDFSISLANRGKVSGSYFRIAPSEDDIEDSLEIEKLSDLSEGKVPLFYIDGFEIATTNKNNDGDDTQIPLYFQKKQLLDEYKKRSGKDKELPNVQVTELFSILGQMVTQTNDDVDEDLKKLALVPPRGSVENAKLCDKKSGKESPYKIGERIIVL